MRNALRCTFKGCRLLKNYGVWREKLFMTETADKQARLAELVAKVAEIPPLPSFIGQILKVAENPISSAEDLNEIISRDPALTAQLLKAANSAFYGFPNKIGTVSLATIILGFNMVKTIALSSSMIKLFKKTDKATQLDPVQFWDHSLKCAVAAKTLAGHYKYVVGGEAFTAGILHDIGRVALAHYAAPTYERVTAYHREKGGYQIDAEVEILGFNHAEFGGYLLKKWSLPPSITEAVMWHHQPLKAENARELVALTHLANYLCHLAAVRKKVETEEPVLDRGVWEILERTEDEEKTLNVLLEAFDADLGKSQEFFRILHGEQEGKPHVSGASK